MNNTDNRVVSLKFDNSGFAQKISETRKVLEKLNSDLKLPGTEEGSSKLQNFFDKFKSGTKDLNKDLESVNTSTDKVQVNFSKFEAFVTGMFMRLGGQAVTFGTKFVKSLSIDNVLDGYREYELKMESMKVIMASNTKYTLDEVNGFLDELNEYADQTIYKFSDMTSAIGRFVAMGVDVKLATAAIKGASSLTALTGGGNAESTRVMYNTAQALATGYMSLMDWKSMENARVSSEWYKQIMEVMKEYKAAGKLTEAQIAFYDSASQNYGAFREGLKAKAVTQDIIVESLRRFSDESTELGTRALKAATEVTTFTKLLDTVKEGVGSAWAQVFESILGNAEKSKALWTDINEQMELIFIKPVDNLSKKLKAWSTAFVEFKKDAKGNVVEALSASDELREGLLNILKFVVNVLNVVKEAWKETFGETPVEYLVELTIRFKKWTDQLLNNEQLLDRIKRIAKDIFKVFKFIKSIISAIANILKKIVWPIVKSIFGFILNVAEIIFTIISSIASALGGFIDGLFGRTPKITKIQQVIGTAKDTVKESTDAVKEAAAALESAEEALDDTTESEKKSTKKTKEATEAVNEYTSALEQAVAEGRTFSDENYIYTKEGLQIPKHVQINPNSMAGQLQKLVQAIKNIGTGTTDVEKNIQNSFKGIGKNVEKTVKKVSSTIKTVSKNSLLYKSSEGIRKVTDKLFTGLDKSFERSKNNIVKFSNDLKGMFGIFHRNKKVSNTLLPGISKSSLNLSTAISKTNKKSSDTIQGIEKNTKSLIDVYDEASKEPDKMTKIGNGVANAISGTLGYVTTKVLQKVLNLVGEETKTIDKKTEITDKKIKEMAQKLGSAIAKGITSISWSKVKDVFLNIWEIIKNLGSAIKEFFSIFKDGSDMMSSSSSSSMGKVEKKSRTIWDIFNGIVKSVSDFTNKIKNSIKSFSVYDKKTGELKSGFFALKIVAESIKSAFYYVLEFIMTIGYAIKRISFSDIVNRLTQFSEWFKNTKIGKWFSTLFSWINQLKEDINEFGFKQAFDNFFNHIWTRIKLFAHDVKEAIINAFEKINTDEWWENLNSSKAYTVVSKLVSNLTGILTKAVKFALSEVVDIIFAKISSFLVIGSTDLSDYFRHAFTEVNGEMVELSTWDKLKYIFENIFNGALFDNLLYTKAGSFITWFTDTLFSSIGAKFKEIKTTFESIFKRNKKDDKTTSYMTSEIDTKGMSKVASDVKELQLENDEGINWDKILGGTIFMFTVARIVGAWKYFIKHTAGDKGGVTSIASSIKEIGASFAAIAAGTTILAILSFSAALYIFVRAMETISELKTDKLQKNVEAIGSLLSKFAGFIFTLTIVVAAIQLLMSSFDLAKITKTGNVFGNNAPRGAGLFGVAAIVFSIAAGVAALGYALSKLAEVDTDKMKEAIKQIKPMFYWLLVAIGAIVLIAGFLGFITAKNTQVPTTIDMGKFNMGNVFQSITNKSPLAGVPELVKNISLMILSLVGAFLGLIAVIWVMHKTIGENETDVLIAKAGAMLGGIFLFIVLVLGVLFAGINKIAKNAGTQNIAKILGNFALVMASLGLAISLMFLSIGTLIHRISDAFSQNETADDVSMMIFTITIMVLIFGAIMYIINRMMDSILQLASMVNGSEQKGKNMQKVLKAFAKVIKSIISPFKWIFAGIGLMVKLMSKADGKTLLSAVLIVGMVMGAVVLMMKELAKILKMVLQEVATSKNNVSPKGAESLAALFKSISLILLVIFGAVILIVGLVTLLAGVIDRMENPERMWTAIGIIGIIFGGVLVSLGAMLGIIAALKKIKIDGKQLWSMVGAFILYLTVVAILAAGIFAAMILILNKVGDNPEAFKEAGLAVLGIFGAIAVLLLLFMAFVVIVDKIKIDVKSIALISLTMIIFAVAVIGIAGAFLMMATAFDKIGEDGFKKIRNALFAMIGIFAIIAVIAGLVGSTGVGDIVIIAIVAIAGAFFLFGLALVAIAAAFFIFVAAFDVFFNTMLRLPELIPAWQAFLKGLREQVIPELQGLLLALQDMAFTLIEGFMLGIWNLILDGLRYWSEHASEPVDLIITGIVAIIDGLANGAARIDAALTNLFTTIGDIVERHWNNLVSRVQGWFDSISDNAVVGFIQGIGSRIGDLWNSGEEMGDAVKEGAQDSLDSHSPSRFMEWLGKMAIKGFEKGIGNKEEQSGLYKAAGSLKDKLMAALNGDDTEKTGILDGLKDKVQGIIDGQDFTATIKGVLDMDEMMDQMNSLDTESLMGNMDMSSMMNNMDTSALMGDTASAFSDMKMSTDASALMNQNGTSGDVYNVTSMQQNNYSPKSLDAATQYRQSKNLVDASLAQDRANDFKPTGKYTEIRIPVGHR